MLEPDAPLDAVVPPALAPLDEQAPRPALSSVAQHPVSSPQRSKLGVTLGSPMSWSGPAAYGICPAARALVAVKGHDGSGKSLAGTARPDAALYFGARF